MTERRGLNANILKYIAAAAMLIDHVGWAFVQTNSVMGQAMHLIGRFTAPIMCYFIAEGYYHTRNIEKYLLRLGIFAAILHYPFVIAEFFQGNRIQFINGLIFVKPQFSITNSSVIFTLFLGLCALTIWKTQKNVDKSRVFENIIRKIFPVSHSVIFPSFFFLSSSNFIQKISTSLENFCSLVRNCKSRNSIIRLF